MKTRNLTTTAALVSALGLAAAGSANAFTVYPGINFLEDDNFEAQIVDTDGDNELDVGDTLEGIININRIVGQSVPGLPSNELIGSGTQLAFVFRTEVYTRVDTGPGIATYTFGPVGQNPASGGTGTGPMLWAYALNAETFPSSGAGCTDQASCEALITTGATPWWVLGFAGDADEQWGSTGTPVNPDIFADISTSLAVGNFKFSQSVIAQNAGPTLGLFALDCGAPPFTFTCAGDGMIQFSASGSVLGTREILALNPAFPYTVSSDLDMKINVIPEPSSLALVGAALLGFFGFRQRNNKA